VTIMSDEQKSRFIATFRLKPDRSFAGLKYQFTTKDGYELSFHGDMVWIGFDASPEEWQRRLSVGQEALKTLLAILTIQVAYAFQFEPIQWIEDKPRDEKGNRSYVLGRIGSDLTVQNEPPDVTGDHIRKGEIYAQLASHNAYYRYALLDYSVSLSFPGEAIVFCARSVDWAQSFFDTIKRSLPKQSGLTARKLTGERLKLPGKYLDKFFKIANDTVIARHTGDPTKIRAPKIEEIRFCVFFSRVVLDRFGGYLWYQLSKQLPPPWQYPSDEKPPDELFEASNSGLIESLGQILSGQLS
jgi:hypothetical protein